MAVKGRSCLVSSWRMSHFGMNPASGGSPPRDSKISGVRAVIAGIFAQEEASVLMLVDLFVLKIRKAENVMMKYIIRARRVSEGENWMIKIIQPR